MCGTRGEHALSLIFIRSFAHICSYGVCKHVDTAYLFVKDRLSSSSSHYRAEMRNLSPCIQRWSLYIPISHQTSGAYFSRIHLSPPPAFTLATICLSLNVSVLSASAYDGMYTWCLSNRSVMMVWNNGEICILDDRHSMRDIYTYIVFCVCGHMRSVVHVLYTVRDKDATACYAAVYLTSCSIRTPYIIYVVAYPATYNPAFTLA